MPDAALAATERQFLRLIGASNRIAQLFVHPFTMAGVERGGRGAPAGGAVLRAVRAPATRRARRAHRDRRERHRGRHHPGAVLGAAHRGPCLGAGERGLDAVLLPHEPRRVPVAARGAAHPPPGETVGGLLASGEGTEPTRSSPGSTPASRPLTPGSTTWPASRWRRRGPCGCSSRATRGGVLVATSPDGFRFVYFQGHPEYDRESLLKEYKREGGKVPAQGAGGLSALPGELLRASCERAASRPTARSWSGGARPAPPHPSSRRRRCCRSSNNTWTDTGKALVNNWLGLVYQLTDYDRRRPFAARVDPADPLGLG